MTTYTMHTQDKHILSREWRLHWQHDKIKIFLNVLLLHTILSQHKEMDELLTAEENKETQEHLKKAYCFWKK